MAFEQEALDFASAHSEERKSNFTSTFLNSMLFKSLYQGFQYLTFMIKKINKYNDIILRHSCWQRLEEGSLEVFCIWEKRYNVVIFKQDIVYIINCWLQYLGQ